MATRTRTPEQKAKDAAAARARRAAKKAAAGQTETEGLPREAVEAARKTPAVRGGARPELAGPVTEATKLSAKKVRRDGKELWAPVLLNVDPETGKRSEFKVADPTTTRERAIKIAGTVKAAAL